MDVQRITIYANLIKKSLDKFNEYTLSVELSRPEYEHLRSLFNIKDGDFPGVYVFTAKTKSN